LVEKLEPTRPEEVAPWPIDNSSLTDQQIARWLRHHGSFGWDTGANLPRIGGSLAEKNYLLADQQLLTG
jgi:hypothetical protein